MMNLIGAFQVLAKAPKEDKLTDCWENFSESNGNMCYKTFKKIV